MSPAQFNMLLDASGSMFHVSWMQAGKYGGLDKLYVYEHLFKSYVELATSGDALRPEHIICVWSFNTRTKLLCEVETKNFHRKKDHIRKEYEKELNSETARGETRLYAAVAYVMDEKISKTRKANKKADFFLVTFTDGRDSKTGSTSPDTMMDKLMELSGRLHIFFITVNLPTNASLYTRLSLRKEMPLMHCESTQPSEISRALNTVQELIKAVLVIVMMGPRDVIPKVSGMLNSSLLEVYNNLKLTNK